MKRGRTSLCAAGAVCLGMGLLTVLAQRGTVGGPIDRVSGSYQRASGTIRYGNTYVPQKSMVQQRRLPSEDRGNRWADGYLPFENRYNTFAYGGLLRSGGGYVRPPQGGTIRYAPANTPSELSSTGYASASTFRYGSSSTSTYRSAVYSHQRTSTELASRMTSCSSRGSSGRVSSYGTMGTVRCGSNSYGGYVKR